MAETVTASNANLKVNGVAVSKTSNSVSDVIQGVTLTLGKVTAADTPVTLTVARDTSTLNTSLSSLVKSYNDLAGILKTLSAYDPATKKGAILQGDSMVRTFQNQLRSMLGAKAGDDSNTLRTLSDVGIAFQLDGTLAINQTRLDSAVNNHFDEIATLFTGTNGYVNTLNNWTKSALGSDGLLAGRTDGIGKTITDLGRRRSAIETRLIGVEARYRKQFTALDAMLSNMNQTSIYLSQQLTALSNNN
jgi:flagellar hook-associated protein 2